MSDKPADRETLPGYLRDHNTRIERLERMPKGNGVPAGGEPGQVLGFDAEGNIGWGDALPPGGAEYEVLAKVPEGSFGDLLPAWAGPMWWAWLGTQEQYDILGTYDDKVLYVIVNGDEPEGPIGPGGGTASGGNVPAGGTTGQVLTKVSPADFDTGWTTPTGGGGGGLVDGDMGDITVSGSGTVLTIDNDAVTYAKLQNVTATDRLLGRATAGAGDVEEIPLTATGRSILDDTTTTAVLTTLGTQHIAVKSTTPTAADYGLASIPVGAIWVQSP